MMREIKFRAWDDEYKLMLYPKAHYVSTGEFNTQEVKDKAWLYYNIGELYNPESNEYVSISSYKLTTMQYTGLKDKNGKEIFEGDIIKYKTNKIQFSLVQWISDGFKTVKKISPTSTRTSTLGNFIAEYQCEVIGNIYENPDLLTNK